MELLPLDDPRWVKYRGSYNRAAYNVVPLIYQLQCEGTSDRFWEIACAELHHQGEVGEASYAFVPYLVDHQSRQRELDATQDPQRDQPASMRNNLPHYAACISLHPG